MDRAYVSDVSTSEPIDGVHLSMLAGGERVNIQHYVIEPGAAVSVHSHPAEQLGYLTRGRFVFIVDGEEYPVEAGGTYYFASGESHGVENRGDVPAEGIDIFSPPRTDPDWAE